MSADVANLHTVDLLHKRFIQLSQQAPVYNMRCTFMYIFINVVCRNFPSKDFCPCVIVSHLTTNSSWNIHHGHEQTFIELTPGPRGHMSQSKKWINSKEWVVRAVKLTLTAALLLPEKEDTGGKIKDDFIENEVTSL